MVADLIRDIEHEVVKRSLNFAAEIVVEMTLPINVWQFISVLAEWQQFYSLFFMVKEAACQLLGINRRTIDDRPTPPPLPGSRPRLGLALARDRP